MKQLLIILLHVCLFSSCEKTEITNDEIRNLIPGGVITTSLLSSGGSFTLVNETFNTYGCYYHEDPSGNYIFEIYVSGKKNNMIYFLKGSGSISKYEKEDLEDNPGTPFTLYSNCTAEVELRDGASYFYTTKNPPEFRVQAAIKLSNFGEVGDPVTVNFTFNTSSVAGFSDMTGIVKTRYVISNY